MIVRHARITPRRVGRPCPAAGGLRTRRPVSTRAAGSPCVVITAPDAVTNPALRLLADAVRQDLQLQALVVAPSHTTTPPGSQGSSGGGGSSGGSSSAALTFDQTLRLQQHPDLGPHTYSLAGGTAADCVMAAVDHTQGLARALSLTPVCVLVGGDAGGAPALSSDMERRPAVAVARLAAQLGLPAVAVCLATPSPSAPCEPAAAAASRLLRALLGLLQRRAARWPAPANFPRAHFPFAQEGRWALGSQLPLPDNHAAHRRAGGGPWQSHMSQAADCWALGDDNSWMAGQHSSSSSSGDGGGGDREQARRRAHQLLQQAFADGDVLLCLNVPPKWSAGDGFASARPGVLWHCWQVAAHSGGGHGAGGSSRGWRTPGAAAAVADGGGGGGRSWQVDGQDLWGRTLPSTSYTSSSSGSAAPAGTNFVGQDNTRAVVQGIRGGKSARSSSSSSSSAQEQQEQQLLPAGFTISRGTLLSDEAACGDVEAVMGGRAAVTLVQAWPAGHPLSCRDDLLLAALDEAQDGLPAWLM